MRYTEGFTGKAILAMKEAICAAEEMGHTYIGSEHLLLGLAEEGGNAAASALTAQQIHADLLCHAVIEMVGRGIPAKVREDCLTPSLAAILEDARERAADAGKALAGTEHLLLAIIYSPCCSAITILKKIGVSLNQLCTICSSDTTYGVRMERQQIDTLSRKACPTLFQYGKQMTDPASPNRYDPLIGRDTELQQIIRTLARRTKKQSLSHRRSGRWKNCNCRRRCTKNSAGGRSRGAAEHAAVRAGFAGTAVRRKISR
ncbi:MAG: hypothetical protein LUC50_03420 [Ruminococcus sp.]|nr:hypothetical protein [Ruminococcus sp.]